MILWLFILVNPFLIDFSPKENLTHEDYMTVQELLRAVDIEPLLEELYVPTIGLSTREDFRRRCTRGLQQVMIDPENGLFPEVHLEKIGKGSGRCFVCCLGYDRHYLSLFQDIPEALQNLGFDGYIYYRLGGFPNPTGKEILYAGVPYSFKIAMMQEAYQLGFNQVVWIDASMLPLRDPTPLFVQLEERGSLIPEYVNYEYNRARIFPKTRALLKNLTGVDVTKSRHVSSQLFGLMMDRQEPFLKKYQEYLEMGTPFLSCFPEEFVFSALVEQSPQDWNFLSHYSLYRYQEGDDPAEFDKLRDWGLYFCVRKH